MSASTDTRLALLSSFGWTIEQENPLHIRHSPSGDFASGFAAQLVPASILSLHTSPPPLGTLPLKIYEIRHLAQFAITTAANAEQADKYETSKIAYNLIFSPACSQRIRTLLDELNISWTWHDRSTGPIQNWTLP